MIQKASYDRQARKLVKGKVYTRDQYLQACSRNYENKNPYTDAGST